MVGSIGCVEAGSKKDSRFDGGGTVEGFLPARAPGAVDLDVCQC